MPVNPLNLISKSSGRIPRKQKETAKFLIAQLGEVGIRVKSVRQDRAVWLKDLLDLSWGLNLLATGTNTGDAALRAPDGSPHSAQRGHADDYRRRSGVGADDDRRVLAIIPGSGRSRADTDLGRHGRRRSQLPAQRGGGCLDRCSVTIA